MNCLPCDVALKLIIANGKVSLEGSVEILHEGARDPVRIAIAAVEGSAEMAAATSSGSRAELQFTQTWDWL